MLCSNELMIKQYDNYFIAKGLPGKSAGQRHDGSRMLYNAISYEAFLDIDTVVLDSSLK
jgi:hypothetical protein